MKKIKTLYQLPEGATYGEMESPVGRLTMVTSSNGLHAILWDVYLEDIACQRIVRTLIRSDDEKHIVATKKQLEEYFQGRRKIFDLPLVLIGTDFQMRAWEQLSRIPYATVISYGEQAQRMGDGKKARAVGMANGVNPISIVVPCHRVVGSNGQLVGFGGGVERKAYLLHLEQQSLKGVSKN